MCGACFMLSGELWLFEKRVKVKVFLTHGSQITLQLEPGKVQPGFTFMGLFQLQSFYFCTLGKTNLFHHCRYKRVGKLLKIHFKTKARC